MPASAPAVRPEPLRIIRVATTAASATVRDTIAVIMLCLACCLPAHAADATPESDPFKTAREILKPAARPARPPLPPSRLPLALIDGERIALVGNSTAERMNLFGHFETLLHQRFPGKKLVVRNFARPADEVGNRQRASDYTKLDDPMAAFGADTYLVFFGFNESFASTDGIEKFKADYAKLLDDMASAIP